MKRLMAHVAVLVCAATVATSALGNVYVGWGASAGFYWFPDINSALLGLDGSGNSTLAQLIWSPDTVADAADISTTHYVTGNDVWLADFVVQEDGTDNSPDTYDYFGKFGASPLYTDGGSLGNSGYIYARIFQDSTVQQSDWYYVGTVTATETKTDPVTNPSERPQSYDMNRDFSIGDPINDGSQSYCAQVIPEPGTLALFGVGVLAAGIFRRRR